MGSKLNAPVIYQRRLSLDHDPDDDYETCAPTEATTEEYSYVIPEDRKLGFWSTSFLIVNRMVGTGIFSTPSTIMQATDSVGASMLFWVLGGAMSLCGLFVYMEMGTALPRSGGEKVYVRLRSIQTAA